MPSSCKASRLPFAASFDTRTAEQRPKPQTIRRTASCGRARGALQAPCGRRPSPSGRESHGDACARACWVDRSASRVDLRIAIVGEKRSGAPGLKRANADSAATADATKRRAGKMNAALEAPLQGRAYAAPARASQSRQRRDPAQIRRRRPAELPSGRSRRAREYRSVRQVASRRSKNSAISSNASRVSGAASLKM
jgi:hypothetical protein